MGAEQRDDDGRVDEDERVGDNDEWRAGSAAFGELFALLADAVEVEAGFEEEAGYERQGSCEAREDVGDGERELVSAGGGVAAWVSRVLEREEGEPYPAKAVANTRYCAQG